MSDVGHLTASSLALVVTMLPGGLAAPRIARAEPDAAANAAPAEDPVARERYVTVVRGERSVHPLAPADAAAFSTRITIDHPPGGTQLVDLLRRVPGAQIKDFGAGQPKTLSLRGADGHHVAIFLDGVRLTAPGREAIDLSLFDPRHLAAIDVRRSAGSARYGASAVGGAVILETPRLCSRRRTSASLGYGAWNTVEARLSHGAGSRSWRYLASGSYRRSDGDFRFVDHNGLPSRRHNNDANIGEALLKIDHIGLPAWHIGLTNSFAAAFRGATGPSHHPSATARQRDLRNLTALRATHRGLLLDGSRIDLVLFHRYGHFRFEETASPPALSVSHESSPGASASWALPLGVSGRVDTGVELRTDLFFSDDTGDRSRFTLDAFVSGEARLWANHVAIVPAVRLANTSGFGSQVVPKLGVIVRPLAALERRWYGEIELLANIGRSFRPPSFQQLYLRVDGFGPNPNLHPEDALNVDAGARWRSRWVSLEAAYFHRWLKNTIITAPVSSFLIRPDNYSDAIAHGVESSAELSPGLCLELRAAYTYTATRFGDPPLVLPGHPRHQVTGRAGWAGDRCPPHLWRAKAKRPASRHAASASSPRRRWPRWLRGLSVWSSVAAQGQSVLDRHNNTVEEGRVMLGAGARYTYRWLTTTATARNLLDKRDAVDTVGFPLPPRSFFVSVDASL